MRETDSMEQNNRPDWDEYFFEILSVVKKRSSCLRRHVAAVIVKDNHILATGYNGTPSGIEHCESRGCLRARLGIPSGQRHEMCRGVHAEQNAIVQAAVNGVSIKGATIYITDSPCIVCAKMLINSKIKKIVYQGDYPDEMSLEMLKEAGVELVKYTPRA